MAGNAIPGHRNVSNSTLLLETGRKNLSRTADPAKPRLPTRGELGGGDMIDLVRIKNKRSAEARYNTAQPVVKKKIAPSTCGFTPNADSLDADS